MIAQLYSGFFSMISTYISLSIQTYQKLNGQKKKKQSKVKWKNNNKTG